MTRPDSPINPSVFKTRYLNQYKVIIGYVQPACCVGAVQCDEKDFVCDSGQCVRGESRCYKDGIFHSGCADKTHLKHCGRFFSQR